MLLRCSILFMAWVLAAGASEQLTPAPHGPFHIQANWIVDADGQLFLIRGTRLPALSPRISKPFEFGAHSATTLGNIRQRFNMNAVWLPIDPRDDFEAIGKVVRTANQLGLLVILSAPEAGTVFWSRCAATFKDYPDVMFAAAADSVTAIRAARARQPIIVGEGATGDPNVIHGFSASVPSVRAAAERIDDTTPVLANIPDFELDKNSAACQALPPDPAAAADLIESALAYLDARGMSWIVSSFEPGRLINEYRYLYATTLENGWTCGQPDTPPAGMGVAVQAHLWSGVTRGLFTVTNPTGGMLLPRGGTASVYGMIGADTDADGGALHPTTLAGVSVQITDARGVARLAPLLHVAPGWAYLNFVVPPACATGPAKIAILRRDGSSAAGPALIGDLSPGLYTATYDGHGPVVGTVYQKFRDGRTTTFPAYQCEGPNCRTVPILLRPDVSTTVRLLGTGFRNAAPGADLCVRLGDIAVPVVGFRPLPAAGLDELTIALPANLGNLGETDLLFSVNGILANVVRLNVRAVPAAGAYRWNLPPGFPPPPVPESNPMSDAKVLLGRYLFYDKRLSGNGTQSCATCHKQELAFTDGRPRAVGSTGEVHPRGVMSLVNVAYSRVLTWSNPGLRTLEAQALIPMFGRHPVELGLSGHTADFLHALARDPIYRSLLPSAFPGARIPFTIANVAKAIAAFERTIISAGSPYDRYHYGEDDAISDSAKRGEVLFFVERTACFRCHGGFGFSDSAFHNNGLYNLPGPLSYPPHSLGIYEHTGRLADVGKFKAPTLRNIALTAPYMHDGSMATLEDVLNHYAAGGRHNPNKDARIRGFHLTTQNRADLLAFLRSLTDEELTRDPRFANPW
jgi:cytochrome c peroxidase